MGEVGWKRKEGNRAICIVIYGLLVSQPSTFLSYPLSLSLYSCIDTQNNNNKNKIMRKM